MAGWSKPTPHQRDSARNEARAFGHRMAGPYQRIGLSAELRCADCRAYVLLPNAYARMAWEHDVFTGPAAHEFCPGNVDARAYEAERMNRHDAAERSA